MEHLEKFFRIMDYLTLREISFNFSNDYSKLELGIYLHEMISTETWNLSRMVTKTGIPVKVSIKDKHFENDRMMRVIYLTIEKGAE